MPTNPTQQTIVDPKGIDVVITDIRPTLETEVSWLQIAYGRAETIREEGSVYPAIFTEDQDYLKLLPDGHLGSHSFFRISSREKIDYTGEWKNGSTEVMLVVWINFEEAYPGADQGKTIAHAVDDIMTALKKSRSGSNVIRPKAVIYEGQYQGYDRELNQDLSRPYGGFAILIDIQWTESC